MSPASTTALLPGTAQRRRAGVRLAWLGAGTGLVAVVAVASLVLGARDVSLADVWSALGGGSSGIGEATVVTRIPRTVLAALVGAALAIAGATMQAVTRNPLADPGILGVSTGAALAVVIGIAFFGLANPYGFIGAAITGAALAATLVYLIGSLGRDGATPLKLTLAGAAMSAALSSLISAILLPRVDVLTTYQFWTIGGVGGADWSRLATLTPVLVAGALVCVLSARGLSLLALGDDLAAGLGQNVARTRLVASAGAVILCGAATGIAGPIGFVGLIVPHVARLLVGADYRWVLPFSALLGAALLVIADVIGRVIARPEEIQVGIVTVLLGGPVFIWIVRRQKVREL